MHPGSLTMPRVLLIDQDEELRAMLVSYLRMEGFRAEAAADARELDGRLSRRGFDLVVLGATRPGRSGSPACLAPSATGVPVIRLAASADPAERAAALEAGAADCLARPFTPRELALRIRNVLGRARGAPLPRDAATRYAFGGWRLDARHGEMAHADGRRIALSGAELRLLRVLVQRPNEVLSRETLLELTRSDGAGEVFDRSIDTQVSRLRRKLEADPRRPALLRTAWGHGYVFCAPVRALSGDNDSPSSCPS